MREEDEQKLNGIWLQGFCLFVSSVLSFLLFDDWTEIELSEFFVFHVVLGG